VKQVRLFIAGRWVDGASTTELTDKYDGRVLAQVHEAGKEQVDEALAALADAHSRTVLPAYRRFEVLAEAARLLESKRAEFESAIIDDAGFTVADARTEVSRAAQTLTTSAEEAKRIHGEMVPLHGAPNHDGRIGFTVRHPLGVVCAIAPFNSPLNTVTHKVAPAIAAGNAVILKPSSLTPISSGLLVELLLEAGLPAELISVVQGGGSTVGQWLLESPVPAFYAFTGSTGVGEHIIRTVGLRKTQLELGSLSSTIIAADAQLDRAVEVCVGASFRKAGQVCTSVQRLYVQRGVADDFTAALQKEVSSRTYGDPRVEGTTTGPVISAREADRIEGWITDAVSAGAELLSGGTRSGQVIAPTVLGNVAPSADVMCHEVFGPVVSIVAYDDLREAIDRINDTPYGLAAGIFTSDISSALDAAEKLRMGSVHINQTSSNRVDLMPYGGVKASGMGLEGPRYAIEEMTEQRLITIGRP
jgi:acyl-CoA reductase-like NAD-dependent aldehyde dehydrogenase